MKRCQDLQSLYDHILPSRNGFNELPFVRLFGTMSGCPSNSRPKLILASRSPRRQELLWEAGYRFEVCAPGENRQVGSGWILGCDTVAECDGRILGKPADEHHARQMLKTLRGREHRVFSGLCLWKLPDAKPLVRVAATTLRMDRLSDRQIEEYLAGGQWKGKAGAFGYQDRLGWVHVIEGSESNVVGLPLELLAEMLA